MATEIIVTQIEIKIWKPLKSIDDDDDDDSDDDDDNNDDDSCWEASRALHQGPQWSAAGGATDLL